LKSPGKNWYKKKRTGTWLVSGTGGKGKPRQSGKVLHRGAQPVTSHQRGERHKGVFGHFGNKALVLGGGEDKCERGGTRGNERGSLSLEIGGPRQKGKGGKTTMPMQSQPPQHFVEGGGVERCRHAPKKIKNRQAKSWGLVKSG